MSSPAHIRVAAQQRMRRLLLACAAGAGLLIALAVAAAVTREEAPPSAVPQAPSAAPSTAYVKPERWVPLPASARRIGGDFPVGFPRTPWGAVATLVAEIEHGWGLDAERAVRSSQVYAEPGYRAEARVKVHALIGHWRTFLGLPAGGEVSPGAYLQARVVGVKWAAESLDRVRVQVLVMAEGADSVNSPPKYRLFSTAAGMRWDPEVRGGDWVYGSTTGRPDPPAVPGTAEFNRLGWSALQAAPE